MKSPKYEKLKWQAGVVEEETERNLKIAENENKLSKMRSRKYSRDQVSFVAREFVLLWGHRFYDFGLHRHESKRDARSIKMDVPKKIRR